MLLTLAQLAADLNVSPRHLERCAARGMPSIAVGARAKRYDRAACLEWLAEHAREESCQSNAPRKAGTKFVSASAVDALTAASRRAHLRVMPSDSKPS
jgi:hypothetical protein